MNKEDLQEVVDCFADTERKLVKATKDIANIARCIDDLARKANADGLDVRAFDLATEHATLAEAMRYAGLAASEVMGAHRMVWKKAEGLALPVPQPRTGGR